MIQKSMKQIRMMIITGAIFLGIVFVVLLLNDLNRVTEKSLNTYRENQNNLANLMVNTAVLQAQSKSDELENVLKNEIKDNFPTSSSVYCIIAKDNQIVFLKDENTTSTLGDETLSGLFDKKNTSSRDNKRYQLSTAEIQYKGVNYTLAVCAKENYLIDKLDLTEVKLHYIGYFVVYGMILTIIIIGSFRLLGTREKKLINLENEIKNSRITIDRLENDKKKNYTNSEREDVYSFYNRSIVDEVIKEMSQEGKAKCILIDITVENLKMEHFVMITAILGRIKVGKSISCYWEENQFKVLLFDSGMEEVQNFIHLFINKYKTETNEKVEDLKIVASHF